MKLVLPIIGEPLPSDVLKALLQGREDLPPAVGGSQVCCDFFVSKIGGSQVCFDFFLYLNVGAVTFVSKLLP